MFSYVSIISVPKNRVMDQIVDGLKDYSEYRARSEDHVQVPSVP